MPSKSKVIVTLTTFYNNPRGKDVVRFSLVRELVRLAIEDGHTVVIVDGSPDQGVKEELKKIGARVFAQSEKGMGPARRQVWREAGKLVAPDVSGILWTEEKPDIIRSIREIVSCMKAKGAHAVIPSRSDESWKTYPAFQRESEQVANLVYNNLFSTPDAPFDPMFGPVCFHPSELLEFAEFSPEKWGLPDTYVQHYVPVFMRSRDRKVVSKSVDFVYPPAQKAEEETALAPEMIKKRLWQLKQLVAAYFTMRQCFKFKL